MTSKKSGRKTASGKSSGPLRKQPSEAPELADSEASELSGPQPFLSDFVDAQIGWWEQKALGNGKIAPKTRELLLELAFWLAGCVEDARDEALRIARAEKPTGYGAPLDVRLADAIGVLSGSNSRSNEHARGQHAVRIALAFKDPEMRHEVAVCLLSRYARETWQPDHTEDAIRAALEGVTADAKGGRGKRGAVHALAALSGEDPSVIRAALKRAL